jgi:hypothetical protein
MINISSLNKGLVAHFRLSSDLQKVGSNIITGDNSTFDALADWTPYNGGALAIVGDWSGGAGTGIGKITLPAAAYGGIRMISLTGLVVGESYYASVKAKLLSGSSVTMYLGYVGVASAALVFVPTATETVFTGAFVATSTTMYLSANSGGASQVILVDDVIVKPLLIADLTPYGNHPENFGVTFGADHKGVANGAGVFDGALSALNIGTDKPNTLVGDITMCAWIYLNSFGGGNGGRIFDNNTLYFLAQSGDSKLWFKSGAGTIVYTTSASISTGVWIHVMATRTSVGILNFYIDGLLNNTPDQDNGTPVAGTGDTYIGNNLSFNRGFDGKIEDPRIYNRVLSADEALEVYNSYKSNLVVS